MKVKNIGKRPHTIVGISINPNQEVEIDAKKEELEGFPFLEVKGKEVKKVEKIEKIKPDVKIKTEKKLED